MKQVLLTGVSGGLGGALAVALGQKGWQVHGLCRVKDRRTEELARRAEAGGWKLGITACDATDPAAVEQLAPWLTDIAPQLDAFIHLAAPRLKLIPFWRETAEDMERQWEIGPRFAARICTRLVRPMSRRGNARILFVLSATTLDQAAKGMASYTVGKYGLLGLARALAAEHAPRISVTCFSPTIMDTPLLADLPSAARALLATAGGGGFLPVERVTQQIVDCLERDAPSSEAANIIISED